MWRCGVLADAPQVKLLGSRQAAAFTAAFLYAHLERVDARLIALASRPSVLVKLSILCEERGCWCRLAECVASGSCSGLEQLATLLDEAGCLSFSEFTDVASLEEATRQVLSRTWGLFTRFSRGAFGREPGLEGIVVLLAPSPTLRLDGSLVCVRDGVAYILAYVHPGVGPESLTDLLYHEVMHVLLHGVLPESLEEEVIDALAPEGVLSKHLGLGEPRECKTMLCRLLERYVEAGLYERVGLAELLGGIDIRQSRISARRTPS